MNFAKKTAFVVACACFFTFAIATIGFSAPAKASQPVGIAMSLSPCECPPFLYASTGNEPTLISRGDSLQMVDHTVIVERVIIRANMDVNVQVRDGLGNTIAGTTLDWLQTMTFELGVTAMEGVSIHNVSSGGQSAYYQVTVIYREL